MITNTKKPSIILPYRSAYNNLIGTKSTTNVTEFCNNFHRNLQNYRYAANNLESSFTSTVKYGITDRIDSIMFLEGTYHAHWLETWRATGAVDGDQYTCAHLG